MDMKQVYTRELETYLRELEQLQLELETARSLGHSERYIRNLQVKLSVVRRFAWQHQRYLKEKLP